MTTFPSITGGQLIRALSKLGFETLRTKGSHHFLHHPDGRCTVVPVHRVTISSDETAFLFQHAILTSYDVAMLRIKYVFSASTPSLIVGVP